jgi:glycosyltransferase involved in cell wall biosynthesis
VALDFSSDGDRDGCAGDSGLLCDALPEEIGDDRYGAEVAPSAGSGAAAPFGLVPNQYVLYVSRLEPENNAHLVIDAYRKRRTDWPLVIVGGAPYAEDYIARLKSTIDSACPSFLDLSLVRTIERLQQNAYCYVHATEVWRTHPALIEAMGAGNCALTLRTPENLEVIGDAGLIYDSGEDLTQPVADGDRSSGDDRRVSATGDGASHPLLQLGADHRPVRGTAGEALRAGGIGSTGW